MDGLLIVDKPAGRTSHDVVARARRVLKEKRVGHTGTLDPFATGVLVLLVGRATRLAQFLAGAEKEYEATIRIGYATTTGDLTGVRRDDVNTADEMNDVDTADDGRKAARIDLQALEVYFAGDRKIIRQLDAKPYRPRVDRNWIEATDIRVV